MLDSGLPNSVDDREDLARFLTSSNHFNSTSVKAAAFLPSPKDQETSVSRHGGEPAVQLWSIGRQYLGGQKFYGAAIVKAADVRATLLEVVAKEPPPRHAAIRGWPQVSEDPDLQKAQQKERALQIASKAIRLLQT